MNNIQGRIEELADLAMDLATALLRLRAELDARLELLDQQLDSAAERGPFRVIEGGRGKEFAQFCC
jgi:hypothetical protein